MRNIWDLTPEELAAEAVKAETRRRKADREAAHLFEEQTFLLDATEAEVRAALPPEEAEHVLAHRNTLAEGAEGYPLVGVDTDTPRFPIWFTHAQSVHRYQRQLPVTGRADTGGFAIGGEELFRILDFLAHVEVWVERKGNRAALLLGPRGPQNRIESLVLVQGDVELVHEDTSHLRDADGILRLALADISTDLRVAFTIGIRSTLGIENASIRISWVP